MAEESKSLCPKYEKTVDLLGKRWTGLVLSALMDGPRRFSEIATYIDGISDRLLSERLQELERAGIAERHVHTGRPVTVEYLLTEKGADLRRVVDAIHAWAERWQTLPGEESVKQAKG